MTTVLPLIRRELAALARRRGEFPVRTVGLAILLLVLGLVWSDLIRWGGNAYSSQQLARIGRGLLVAFNITLTSVLVLALPATMAGTLAGEREEKTLDLLRMTPLGPFGIVLSKLVARLGTALLWIVLAAPFVLVPLFFGGVTPADACIAVLYPVGAAVWAASAALLASAFCARTLTAALATYIGVAAWHALAAILLFGAFNLGDEAMHALPIAAYFVLPVAWIEDYGNNLGPYLWAIPWVIPLETLAFLAVCVGVAAWRLGRESEARGESAAAPRRRSGAGNAQAQDATDAGRRRIWDHAVAWKEIATEAGSGTRRLLGLGLALYVGGFLLVMTVALHDLSALAAGAAGGLVILSGLVGAARRRWRKVGWTLATVVGTLAGALVVRNAVWGEATLGATNPLPALAACVSVAGGVAALVLRTWYPALVAAVAAGILVMPFQVPDRMSDDIFYGGPLVLASYLGVMAPLMAAGAVAGERKRGTLESLVLTPLTAGRIVSGKALGIWAALAPGLLVLVVQFAVLAGVYRPEAAGVALSFGVFAAWLAMSIELGLFVSSAVRKPVTAILVTMGSLLLYVAGIPFLALLASVGRGGESIFYLNPVFWFVMSLEYREGRPLGGPINSAADFFGGYVFFVLCCVGLCALFRNLAATSLRGEAEGAPAFPPRPVEAPPPVGSP